MLAVIAVSASLLSGFAAISDAEATPGAPSLASLSGAEFDRGNIISDENFFNPNAMSAAQVQSFIESKVSCASGATCLANLRVDTFDIPGTPMCSTYRGAGQESAATIIFKVGQACGISQAAILVILQKEQSLVTARAPSVRALSAAMGAGCYDNGQPCIGEYAGFFNQVFNGAFLLKRYTQPPGTGPGTPYTTRFDRSYPVGQLTNILVSPSSCGTLPVFVTNQATHALYVYTPYTPNASALANLYGTGDVCASYGNRNFWRFYYDWFGNPLQPIAPTGWFDGVSAVGTSVTASGWAGDGRSTAPMDVMVSVDGAPGTKYKADIAYPGLGGVHPQMGDNHGFSAKLAVSPGTHSICVTVINNSNSTSRNLGCKSIAVAAANSPIGWLDRVYVAGGQATAEGWAVDPDVSGPISVELSLDGAAGKIFAASNVYPGLGAARPGFGDSHGFSATVPVSSGRHTLCVTAIDNAGGPSRIIGCSIVAVSAASAPVGWLDKVSAIGNQVTAQGWAIDSDTVGPISVAVSVDGGAAQSFPASNPYPGLGGAKPGFGDNHGFSATLTVPDGKHTVCVTAINDAGSPNRDIGCSSLTVTTTSAPIGWLDSVDLTYQEATVSGWAIDLDTVAPISVSVTVDGAVVRTEVATASYPGLGAAKPGFGDAHGFSVPVSLPLGKHTVCVTAINNSGSTNREIGCRTVISTSQPAYGWLDSVSVLGRMITASGWTIDPDQAGPISVRILVDGVDRGTVPAANTYPGLGSVYPAFGDAHGFTATAPASPGNHSVCITAINNDQGPDRSIGCQTVTVAAINAPLGWLDSITASGATVTAKGWAFDPDITSPIAVQIRVDGGSPLSFLAGNAYPGLGSVFGGFGDNHGFSASVVLPSGPHSVCVTAINDVAGADRELNCTAFSIS